MSQSPFEHAGSLCIGTVDFVSPDEIKVALDIEAPESVALNAGGPRPFPRVNSYLLMPVDDGYLVGQIEWITVERSAFPKRRGMQDFGLVDLPYPLRKMSLNPLGTLRKKTTNLEMKKSTHSVAEQIHFRRLVQAYCCQPRSNFGPSSSRGDIGGSRLELARLPEMPKYASIRTACLDVISPFLVIQAAESRALSLALSRWSLEQARNK